MFGKGGSKGGEAGGYEPVGAADISFDPFGAAEGGVVGPALKRYGPRFPIAAWMNAPRFDIGGIVGPNGARPIIAHDGELISNLSQQRNLATNFRALASAASAPKQNSGPPVIHQAFHLNGTIAESDVHQMVRRGAAAAIGEYHEIVSTQGDRRWG